jgi:hypothetical protein
MERELEELRAQIRQQGQLACFVYCTHARTLNAVTRFGRRPETLSPHTQYPKESKPVVRKQPPQPPPLKYREFE